MIPARARKPVRAWKRGCDMAKNQRPAKKGVSAAAALILSVCCLAVGLLVGRFVLGTPTAADPLNKTAITAGELETVVGTYTYGGETHAITAREVIEDSSSLAAAVKEDGTYDVPTADAILGYVRNAIIMHEAESRGITVTDEDVSAYALEILGTDDYAAIASTYGLTEEVAKRMLGEAAMMKQLRDQVIADTGVGEAPAPPTAPEDGNGDATSKEWADYVIALLGDEWDTENNTWARTDGTYYATLQTYPISNEEASYEAAEQAYYIAYTAYSTATSNAAQEWTNFVNGLLGRASIEIATLCS